MKIYNKRGNTNYKEKKLIKEIESKLAQSPELANTIQPANSYDELKALHDKLCVVDVDYEIVEEKTEGKHEGNVTDTDFEVEEESGGSKEFVSPMNKQEPKIRGYVQEDELPKGETKEEFNPNQTFGEPTTFQEAFELPPEDENTGGGGNKNVNTGSEKKEGSGKKGEQKPLNPQFNEMSGARKKKSSSRFAKYVVFAVCALAERGFVWYATKDINASKLAEYEVSGELDLSPFISMPDGQQATVKEFFLSQCYKAEQLAVIPEEEKLDLAEALTEVLLEKGVAPTPMQELGVIALKIFGVQGLVLMQMKSETNSVLEQLRDMAANNQQTYAQQRAQREREEARRREREAEAERNSHAKTSDVTETKTEHQSSNVEEGNMNNLTDEHELGSTTETKE